MQENIIVKGAKENNLKNIDVTIPRNKLTVFTGLSGSGKSTLAFDTIFLVRAAVLGADGKTRRREHRGAVARDLHRPENDLAQPPFDGGNGDGDIRLFPSFVRAYRRSALP